MMLMNGSTVSYVGGFKVQAGAQTTLDIAASAALTNDLSFTIMDGSGAVALTASIAALFAVQTLTF
jgi:hypothetical protein